MRPKPHVRRTALAWLLALAFVPGAAHAAPPASAPAAWDSLAAWEGAGRWRAVDSVATRLVSELDGAPPSDSFALARALAQQGGARRALGRLTDGEATRALSRAGAIAARLGPRAALLGAQAHLVAAQAFNELARPDSALAAVAAGRALLAGTGRAEDSLRVLLALREGQAWRLREDYPAAAAALVAGWDLARARFGEDWPGAWGVHNELGRVYTQDAEYDLARTHLERAAALVAAATGGSTQRLELVLANRATLERRAGDPGLAVEIASRGYDLYVARAGEDGPQVAAQLAGIAYTLLSLGDYARARTLLERAVEKEAVTLPPAHPRLLQNRIALAIAATRLGDLAAAGRQLDLADSLIAAGGGTDRSNLAFAATVRVGLDMREGRFADARRRLRTAARDGSTEVAARVDLAARLFETLRAPADAPLADSLARVVAALAESTAATRVKNWPALLEAQARAEDRVGRRARAWRFALHADTLQAERLRWELALLPDRAALVHDDDAPDPSQVLADLADPRDPAQVHRAWDALVRRRGAARAAVAARRALPRGADAATAGAHARWQAALRRHAQHLVAGAFDGDAPGAREAFAASRRAVEEAERAYAVLAGAAGASAPADSVSLARVLASLAPGAALVAFVRIEPDYGDAALAAFVARGGRLALVRLGAEPAVAELVRAWTERLAEPPPAPVAAARAAERAARRAGRAVRAALWDPLQGALRDAADVYVVAAGPVRDLPWLALPAAGERYLADDGPRVHVLLAERDLAVPPGAAADGGLLAVGDPDFDATPAGRPGAAPRRRLPGGCEHAPARLASLPGARAEVRALAAAWTAGASPGPALVLAGADATESRFRALAAGRTALHIATHGILGGDGCTAATPGTRGVGGVALLGPRVAPARAPKPAAPPPPPSPWLGRDAWLAFAGANRVAGEGDDDGWLTADEAVTLDLRGTSLVVLSACQSGVAERWSYDAVLGMRRAFHLAGARCVLASQWPVADDATRAWMEAFYAAAPAPAGAALRHASRTVLAQRRAAGRSTHPFYWAAFTATGD